MRTLLFIALLLPLHLLGAVGDILSLGVSGSLTNTGSGYALDIEISGLSTNGTFNLGWGGLSPSNYVATSLLNSNNPKAILTVTSPGFDATGTSNNVVRKVYGTFPLRQHFPNNSLWDITNNGSSVTVRVNLSDFLYAGDTATATLLSGLYSQGTTNSAAANAMSVNNNSVLPYPFTIANWAVPGFWVITNNSFTLRAVAFQAYGHDRMPVACVQFKAYDQHTHTNSVTVSGTPTIDGSLGDAGKVQEYVATMSAATFTDGDTVTCQLKAFPWVGTTATVADSSNPAFTNSLLQPLTLVANAGGGMGTTVCYWSGSGNDVTAIATNLANSASISNLPAKTLTKAFQLIATYNKNHNGRTNDTGDIVYMLAGTNYLGDPSLFDISGNSDRGWASVLPAPGLLRSQCVLTQQTTLGNRRYEVPFAHFYNLTFVQNVDGVVFDDFAVTDKVWVDNCFWSGFTNGSTSCTLGIATTNIYTTDCLVSNMFNSTPITKGAFIRGNLVFDCTQIGTLYTVIGNVFREHPSYTSAFESDANYEGQIFAYNECFNMDTVLLLSSFPKRWGTAIVCNVLEKSHNDVQILMGFNNDSALNYTTNSLLWYNTTAGNRANMAYNDTSTNTIWHMNWHSQNNMVYNWPCKQDTFSTLGTNRIGGWAVAQGAGAAANIMQIGTWPWEYAGMNSLIATNFLTVNVFGFVHDASQINSSVGDGTGNGNYNLLSTAPGFGWPVLQTLPFDVEGNARGLSDAPGAYASGNVRKGAFF